MLLVLHIRQSLSKYEVKIAMLKIAMPRSWALFGPTFYIMKYGCGVSNLDILVYYGIDHLGKELFRSTQNRVTRVVNPIL